MLNSVTDGDTTVTTSINDNETLTTKVKAKLNTLELDADIKAGMVVNPATLVYLRLGAALNRLTIDADSTLTINDANGLPTSSTNVLNLSHAKYVIGFRAGIGGEYFFTDNMTGTLDYIYTWYGSQSVSGTGNVINTFDGLSTATFSNSSSVNVHTQSLMLGINYYFSNLG